MKVASLAAVVSGRQVSRVPARFAADSLREAGLAAVPLEFQLLRQK